jgi:hypothetical protein
LLISQPLLGVKNSIERLLVAALQVSELLIALGSRSVDQAQLPLGVAGAAF